MPEREAELARGFVLGQDDRIDPRTVEDFRRSGLSHLLAVSGQNVVLLALLAMPVLGALGIPLRARLVWVLALIAVYVPLTGAGPSIQRAGVMGALGPRDPRRAPRLAPLRAGCRGDRDPRARSPIAGDVGWQLSFAAVVGILLLAAPLRRAIAARIGSRGWRRRPGRGRGADDRGDARHRAADRLSTSARSRPRPSPPTCWRCRRSRRRCGWGCSPRPPGRCPVCPVAPINALDALLLAYIAQVAAWCGRPSWAYLEVRIGLAGLARLLRGDRAGRARGPRLGRRRGGSRRRAAARAARRPARSARPAAARRSSVAAVALLVWALLGRRGGDGARGTGHAA